MPIPKITKNSVLRAIKELIPDLPEIKNGPHESTAFDLLWKSQRLPPKVVLSRAVQAETGKPFPESKFSGGQGAGRANVILRRLGFIVVPKVNTNPGSSFDLYSRYSRQAIYATQGIAFSQQNQNLIQGLSPRFKDGSHFIFITLNKEGLAPEHGYEDQLFANTFIWVTRRDRGENHPEYVHLREPECRVSLFLRTNAGEEFAYLGGLNYKSHRQFTDTATGKVQQKYIWTLESRIPDGVLEELTFGLNRATRLTPKRRAGRKQSSRMPSNFDEMKKAYSYAIDSSERTVIPEHQNYQVRLNRFLNTKGIVPDMERDFVDVGFSVGHHAFIGEIKVTTNLTAKQAFRAALGQVLDYAHALYPQPPNMIIFLDHDVDSQRLNLATKLGIAVVVERGGKFELTNPDSAGPLSSVFAVRESGQVTTGDL